MPFVKAVKYQKKLKVALTGPTGSGKTRAMLEMANYLVEKEGGRMAVIDTENGRAALFAGMFDFDTAALSEYNPKVFVAGIQQAAKDGYTVLGIDSLSHAWDGKGGVLDRVNQTGGNSFTDGWGKVGTPLQRELFAAILAARMHLICTMRSDMEMVLEANERGKMVPKQVGMKPIQRKDVQYEFDLVILFNMENAGQIIKCPPIPGLDVGMLITKDQGGRWIAEKMYEWLSDGAPIPEPPPWKPANMNELTNWAAERSVLSIVQAAKSPTLDEAWAVAQAAVAEKEKENG